MRKQLPRRVLLLPVTGMLSGALLAMSFTLPMSQGESEPTIAKGPVRTPAPPLDPPAPPHPNELPGPVGEGQFAMVTQDNRPFITGATYASMPFVTPLNPAGPQETMTRWVEGWGVDPAHAHDGTVYVMGHAWATAPLVFNPFSEVVTADALNKPGEPVESLSSHSVSRKSSDVLDGYKVMMRDGEGRERVWVVDDAFLIDKYEAIDDADLMDDSQKGRIVMIACSVDGANDLGYNVVVVGHLEGKSAEPDSTQVTSETVVR